MAKSNSGGTTIGTGFKLNDPQPIADYMVVDFISDLATIPNQFIGMTTFVKESDCNFEKQSTGWKPVGSKKTIQNITSGGNYNALEVTGDFLVFTNENAQAIINGVYGKSQFKIINLSTTYEVKINDKSPSITGLGKQINLPTASGSVGVRGSAEIIQIDTNNFYVSDVWGSKYRPEFKGLTETELMTVDQNANGGTLKTTEFIVFRDAQSVAMTKADLNAAYPLAKRPFDVVCNQLNLVYRKTDDSANNWKSINLTTVS